MEGRIKNIMSAVFEISISDIDDESSVDTIKSWDSLKHMNLIIALEEEFQITIPDEEVGNLISYPLIVLILKEILSNSK